METEAAIAKLATMPAWNSRMKQKHCEEFQVSLTLVGFGRKIQSFFIFAFRVCAYFSARKMPIFVQWRCLSFVKHNKNAKRQRLTCWFALLRCTLNFINQFTQQFCQTAVICMGVTRLNSYFRESFDEYKENWCIKFRKQSFFSRSALPSLDYPLLQWKCLAN